MKSYLKYFMVCFCLNFIEGSFRCDYTYSNVSDGWFKHFDIRTTWFVARLRCTLEGAVLASPTTEEIKSDMINFIKDSTLKRNIFTGIHATLSQGDYNTVEGTPLATIPVTWAKNEPDNENNKERCISFNSNGELADKPCEEIHPYICFRPENPQVEANECGTLDQEYQLDTRTNKCYKFHMVPRNFSRASMACTAEGGHLAIINSEIEATILSEIFSKVPRSEMLGMAPSWKEVAFIGFYDWNERGDWRTIHGQTLSETGYSKFDPSEPNNLSSGEFCGSIYRSGLLNDLWCHEAFTFICEKSPDYPAMCRAHEEY